MIYYENIKRQLTQQELDGNFEQLLLKARKLGADMPITLRKDLTRPLTPREMDTNFQSLDLAVKKARYGDGPYPAAEYIFDGATVLPAGLTFSRPSKAWGWRNGVLAEYEVNEPVFEDGGLRLEPQVTNLIRYSNELGNERWGKFGVDIQADGDAWRMTRTAELEGDYAYIWSGRDFAAGTYTFKTISFVVGARSVTEIGVSTYALSPHWTNRASTIELYDGAGGNLSGSNVDGNYKVTSIGASSSLLVEIFNWSLRGYTASSQRVLIGIPPEYSTGDYVTLSHFVGMQDTADPTRTLPEWISSYIPTEDEPATRAADQFQWTGSSFDRAFNPAQGALILRPKTSPTAFSALGRWHIGLDDGKPTLRTVNTSGGIIDEVQGDELSTDVRNALGLAWTADTLTLYVNGALVGSIPRTGTPDGLNLRHDGVLNHERITSFPERPTEAKMQEYTYV